MSTGRTYTTGLGDRVTVQMGDALYVDEGDSVGDREFAGVVTAMSDDMIDLLVTGTNLITREPSEGFKATIRPGEVCDLEVLSHEGDRR